MSDRDGVSKSDAPSIDPAEQRQAVRERYGGIATDTTSDCCDTTGNACCSDTGAEDGNGETEFSRVKGYEPGDLRDAPDGANLGLGCGNPTAIAALEPGATVVDLGSGGGFDCFLAAREVGPEGQVIGVDMTPEMIETARENAREHDGDNVEFRLGEIEHLPVADETVDVIISNCVVNLSPDKPQVFREAFRVLRPAGRLAIADVVLTAPLPPDVRADPSSVSACVAGASPISELEAMLDAAGFVEISIAPKDESETFIREWDDDRDLSEYLVSATIEARKPADR